MKAFEWNRYKVEEDLRMETKLMFWETDENADGFISVDEYCKYQQKRQRGSGVLMDTEQLQ